MIGSSASSRSSRRVRRGGRRDRGDRRRRRPVRRPGGPLALPGRTRSVRKQADYTAAIERVVDACRAPRQVARDPRLRHGSGPEAGRTGLPNSSGSAPTEPWSRPGPTRRSRPSGADTRPGDITAVADAGRCSAIRYRCDVRDVAVDDRRAHPPSAAHEDQPARRSDSPRREAIPQIAYFSRVSTSALFATRSTAATHARPMSRPRPGRVGWPILLLCASGRSARRRAQVRPCGRRLDRAEEEFTFVSVSGRATIETIRSSSRSTGCPKSSSAGSRSCRRRSTSR